MEIFYDEIKPLPLDLTEVKVFRKRAGLTQQQMAELLGIKDYTYARIERNCSYSKELLNRICEILGIDPALFSKDSISKPTIKRTPNNKTSDSELSIIEKELIEIFRTFYLDDQIYLLNFLKQKTGCLREIISVTNKEKRIVELFKKLSNEKRIEFYCFLDSICKE